MVHQKNIFLRFTSRLSGTRYFYRSCALAMMLAGASTLLSAQGILTVTPSRSVATEAGNGLVGSTGDNGMASAATLANPSAVVYDSQGNLYVADAGNHVVREVSAAGVITVFAGTEGLQGYGGDNGPASAAVLDTPAGLALDLAGNLYIADSHNHRIRKVSGGIITTVAGNGTAGFSGDEGASTVAQFSLPSAVAVDADGTIYVADTNNQRIRMIRNGLVSTIAGNGEQLFSGDGSAATSAVLDSPTGVAVDGSGNVYVADRHNHRVRMIAGATISTIAGSGAPSLSGGFSGEGAAASSASLSKPISVSVDPAGTVYIADTGNQRIRQLGGGAAGTASNVIATVAGTGEQGFGGDGAASSSVNLDTPKSIALDAVGNLALSDTLNQRLRIASLPSLIYANDGVGILSPMQTITLANTGTSSIMVSSVGVVGPFRVTGGSCMALPISLAPSASCTESVTFLPSSTGAASGKIVIAGVGLIPQSILLHGVGVPSSTSTTLVSNLADALLLQPVTFTVLVAPAGVGVPTQSVTLYDGANAISPALALTGSTVSFTTSVLDGGSHSITAAYSGDANYTASHSISINQPVIDFGLTLGGLNPAGSIYPVRAGQAATYNFVVPQVSGPSPFAVAFSATGLPPGATVSFTPDSLTPGSVDQNVTMTILTAKRTGSLHPMDLTGGAALAFMLFLFPVSRRLRRMSSRLRLKTLCGLALMSAFAMGSLTGCGTGETLGQEQSYTIQVVGTMTGTGGATLQHAVTVTLNVL